VDEWLGWAASNDVAPEVMAFAREYPQVFERYDMLDKKEKNPYIFSPLTGNTKAFCSPRSLEKAGNLIKQRDALGDALLPALCGTVGEAAARDMEAMVMLADQMPASLRSLQPQTRPSCPVVLVRTSSWRSCWLAAQRLLT
jgi:hypothetical protein